jgi:hypothetical protein
VLLESAPYRELWRRQQFRSSLSGALSQAAVARVIANHLWASGDRPEADRSLPRKSKDLVYRALGGRSISPQTLRWFIDAFEMSVADENALWETYEGRMAQRPMPLLNTLRMPQTLPVPQLHRTVMVFERRVIDASGRAAAHRSTHGILAWEDGVDRYPCFASPRLAKFTLVYGGKVLPADARRAPTVIEISLGRSLRKGEYAAFEYLSEYGRSRRVDTEYRRVASARTRSVSIAVEFDPGRLPKRVWWAIWDDYRGGNVLSEEPVTLDEGYSVQRFLPFMENAAAGFRWEW